jgi:RNA polymerase sigma-70 factor (ECF subfamily)
LIAQPPGEGGSLVARILAGDRAAFGELVSRYHRVVFGIAYRMTGSAAEAEDLTQEVFLRVFRSLGRFDLRFPLGPWVRKIASNASLNFLRRRQTEGRLAAGSATSDEAASIADPAAGPEERLAESGRARRLDRALAKLPENQRLAFTLKYVEGLTADEIALAMDAPRNTIKTWLLRARERLREELADEL